MKLFLQVCAGILMLAMAKAASFAEAQSLAKQGAWDAAITTYEALLQQEGPSASVYYNLGVCYQHKADPGRAVLFYERARALTPRAADVRNNLSKLREQESIPELRTLSDGLPLFTAWLSRDEWTLLIWLGAVMLVVATWLIFFFANKKIRWICGIAAVLAVVMVISSAWIRMRRMSENGWAVVLPADQSLLISPFPSSGKLTSCPAGSLVRVESDQGDYVYVQVPSGESRGWLRRDSIGLIDVP